MISEPFSILAAYGAFWAPARAERLCPGSAVQRGFFHKKEALCSISKWGIAEQAARFLPLGRSRK